MSSKKFHLQATIHIINRCNQLLKRKNGSDDVKQEYHYWIHWLKNQLKSFHQIDEKNKKKILKILDKSDAMLKEDLGNFNFKK